jgi:DNA-binding transcriptional ArsR family regulator
VVDQQRRISDPRDLRALAHPVRIAIIELLNVHGAMTATELGERLDESPANCSWHLRKLAEHGYVEESAGGRGRRRPWKATSLGYSWSSSGEPEAMLAGRALSRMFLQREVDRLVAAQEHLASDDAEWQEAADVTQSGLWLTAAELRELNQKVQALLLDRLDRHTDPSRRPPGSRLCAVMAWGVPTYGVADPTPEEGAR